MSSIAQLAFQSRKSVWTPSVAPGLIILAPTGPAFTRRSRPAALNPTRVPTLLSLMRSDSDSESSSDSDSESDVDSDYSASSVSTAATSVCLPSESGSDYPCVAATPCLPTAPRGCVRAPAVAALPNVTRYLYQGGATNVVSGGVMLGARSAPAVPATAFKPIPAPRRPTTSATATASAAGKRRAGDTWCRPSSSSSPVTGKANASGSWRRASATTIAVA